MERTNFRRRDGTASTAKDSDMFATSFIQEFSDVGEILASPHELVRPLGDRDRPGDFRISQLAPDSLSECDAGPWPVCGPGLQSQAHKEDEYADLMLCENYIESLQNILKKGD